MGLNFQPVTDDRGILTLLCNPDGAPASTRLGIMQEHLSAMLDAGEISGESADAQLQLRGLELALLEIRGEVFALENAERIRAANAAAAWPWWRRFGLTNGAVR